MLCWSEAFGAFDVRMSHHSAFHRNEILRRSLDRQLTRTCNKSVWNFQLVVEHHRDETVAEKRLRRLTSILLLVDWVIKWSWIKKLQSFTENKSIEFPATFSITRYFLSFTKSTIFSTRSEIYLSVPIPKLSEVINCTRYARALIKQQRIILIFIHVSICTVKDPQSAIDSNTIVRLKSVKKSLIVGS